MMSWGPKHDVMFFLGEAFLGSFRSRIQEESMSCHPAGFGRWDDDLDKKAEDLAGSRKDEAELI